MRVGLIVAQGVGNGHRARCDALRSGLLAAGHEVVGCFAPSLDWCVVDDPHFAYDKHHQAYDGKTLLIRDDLEPVTLDLYDILIRPFIAPELAWVDRTSFSYRQVCFGMSNQGQALKDQLWSMRNNYCYDNKWTLGAPGHSSWERCAAGIPTMQIIFAEGQRLTGKALEDAGAAVTVWNTLDEGEVQVEVLQERIEACMNAELLTEMGKRAQALCDGKGVERTIKLMEEMA